MFGKPAQHEATMKLLVAMTGKASGAKIAEVNETI
jgi:hypothetical protein